MWDKEEGGGGREEGGVQRLVGGKFFARGEIMRKGTEGVENTVRNGGGEHCRVGNRYMYIRFSSSPFTL